VQPNSTRRRATTRGAKKSNNGLTGWATRYPAAGRKAQALLAEYVLGALPTDRRDISTRQSSGAALSYVYSHRRSDESGLTRSKFCENADNVSNGRQRRCGVSRCPSAEAASGVVH
jgi:hypothetical protein